jgi:hypothetical protein
MRRLPTFAAFPKRDARVDTNELGMPALDEYEQPNAQQSIINGTAFP